MKKLISISAIILFVTTGCGGDKPSTDDFITVDVTASYPKKELILQDFLDVEYVPLETTDEFLTTAYVQAIDENSIVVRNLVRDGNIFFFDKKNGKGLRIINRLGQGGEEYVTPQKVSLDESNNEMFVNDNISEKILVYDLSGKFKRSFRYKERTTYSRIYPFDRDNLIAQDKARNRNKESINQFLIISKQDGSVTKEIQIPYEKKKDTHLVFIDAAGRSSDSSAPINEELIPYGNSWLLVDPSSDTIYSYSPNSSMKPIIVRKPSIQSMEPEIFLFPGVITDRYYFMQTVKREYDFTTHTGFPRTDLMYDRQEKTLFEYVVYNDDFTNKRSVNLGFELTVLTVFNNDDVAFVVKIEAAELVEAYKKGQLKGRLKEIAAALDEESNAVIMLAKYKQ
jgi:hypothetical protein